ncbi:hypothetical protein GEMRC1_008293 [Eukaryota sp. GEM-RC1]
MYLCLKLLFEIHVLKDPISATVTISTINTLDIDCKPDESIIIWRAIQQLEALRRQQSTGQDVDTSSFVLFQRQQTHLAELHRDCLDGLYAFWTVLSKPKVDLTLLPSILGIVHKSKQTIVSSFTQLLRQHGNQQSLLTSYASYVREVECDEERAIALDEQAQELSASERNSSQGASSYAGSFTISKSGKKKKTKRSSKFNLDSMTTSGGQESKRSAIAVLQFSVIVAFIIMTLIAAASFLLSANVLASASDRIDQLYELSHVHSVSELIGLTAGRVFLNLNGQITENFANVLIKESEHLTFHLRRLSLLHPLDDDYTEVPCPRSDARSIKPPSSDLQTEMRTLRFPVILVNNFVPLLEEARVLSAWNLGLAQALHSTRAGTILDSGTSLTFEHLTSIRGSLNGFSNALDNIYDWLVSDSDSFFSLSFAIQILMNILISVVILVIGFVLFAKSFTKITDERITILNLFLYIPQTEIQKLMNDPKFDYMRKKKRKAKTSFSVTASSDEDSDTEVSCKSKSKIDNDVLFELQETNSSSSEEKDKTHVPVPILINILTIALTIICLAIGGVSIFLLLNITNDNDEVNSQFRVALDAINTAADVTLIDHDVSAAMQLFTAFGDDQFLLKYFNLIHSGRRQRALTSFLALDLTEDQLLSISQVGTYANAIRRLEFISGRLICSVFDVDESLCSRFNGFNYDAQLETNYFRDKLEFDDVFWYSTLEQDLERSVDDRLNIARNAQYNSRLAAVFLSLLFTLEGTAIAIVDSLFDSINEIYNGVSSEFLFFWAAIISTTIIVIIISVIGVLNRKRLRVAGFFLYIFVALFVVLIASAVYFSTTAESVFVHDISPLIIESRRVFDMVVAVEWQFNFLRRRFDQLTVSNTFEHFVSAQESYQTLRQHVASFDSSFVSHPALIQAIDSINHQLDLIDGRLMEYIQRVQIIATLATYHLPEYESSTLVNISWDIDQLPLNERNTWVLPHGYSLSNSETDLSKEVEYSKNTSRAILTSKYFQSLTRDVVDSLAEIRKLSII